jgi:HCOMODA/2-hydroxy-3-carboxy-muconic semialdehyde decarboxylase
MRGHGNVVIGRSLPEVVFRAVYTEINARLQADAMRLGDGQVIYLSDSEAAASMATNAGVLSRAWELWKAAALGKRG